MEAGFHIQPSLRVSLYLNIYQFSHLGYFVSGLTCQEQSSVSLYLVNYCYMPCSHLEVFIMRIYATYYFQVLRSLSQLLLVIFSLALI